MDLSLINSNPITPKRPNRNPIIKPNLSVCPFLLAIKEPIAPNPTANARAINSNEFGKLNFGLVFYEIIAVKNK